MPGCRALPVYRLLPPLISEFWRPIHCGCPDELSKMQIVSCRSLTPSIPLSAGERGHILQPQLRVLWELVTTPYLPLHSPILKLARWSLSQHPLCLSHFSEVENSPHPSRFNSWAGSPSLISTLCPTGMASPIVFFVVAIPAVSLGLYPAIDFFSPRKTPHFWRPRAVSISA